MLTAIQFMTAQGWEYPKYPPLRDWINTLGYTHKTEHYTAAKSE